MKKSRVTEETTSGSTYPGVQMMSSCDTAYPYRYGSATTVNGVVGIYDQSGNDAYTRLWMIHAGKTWQKTFARTFTDRGLLTVAGRFAREVAAAGDDEASGTAAGKGARGDDTDRRTT